MLWTRVYSVKKALFGFVTVSIISITLTIINQYKSWDEPVGPTRRHYVTEYNKINHEQHTVQLSVENRALLFLRDLKEEHYLAVAFLYAKFQFHKHKYVKKLPPLVDSQNSNGLYSVIVFEDMRTYLQMDKSDRYVIDIYCQKHSVGLILFSARESTETVNTKVAQGFPFSYKVGMNLRSYEVLPITKIPHLTRTSVVHNISQFKGWTVFQPNHTTYKPISVSYNTVAKTHVIAAMLDDGEFDNVKRIFFGYEQSIWIHKLLFLDCLAYLTRSAMKLQKIRYIQIDIDDMFLGANGTKMVAEDAIALVKAQASWREQYVPGFNFYVGFNGNAYRTGLPKNVEGDEKMMELRQHVKWFDHTFKHVKAHKFNLSDLITQMELSKQFAQQHEMVVDPDYSVAPHHSGVFPVHQALYDAWHKVWNIKVTSTEEYPHLRPPWNRRGFVYDGIQVLPRQVCGLYTKNLYYKDYPRGPEMLEASIWNGELFDTILYNYVNIYMTHQQNYGHDRLSLYTFEKLFKHVNTSSTLLLKGAPPPEMSKFYFETYPSDVQPIWQNPCEDPRHMEIWNQSKSCRAFPSLVVVGPQKTGTTALYHFLKLHPNITSNSDSPTSFEELQFFGSNNYLKGIDWYLQFFSGTRGINFEKSATYFDKSEVPQQMHALLPHAKIIIILLNPIERAYSWYHHAKAHNDSIALTHSFFEVISANSKAVKKLRSRLLKPGFYYEHIQRWRQYYSDSQIMYIDGDNLRRKPHETMNKVQKFLKLKYMLDYKTVLRYDEQKGFFCIHTGSKKKAICLGKSKGRSQQYGQVDDQSRLHLNQIFRIPNMYLKQILQVTNNPIPKWLRGIK